METTFKAYVLHPGCDLQPIDIPLANSYPYFRACVGGMVEGVGIRENLLAYVNEEGLLIGAMPNIQTETGNLLAGTIIFVRKGALSLAEELDIYESMTDDDLAFVKHMLAHARRFYGDYDVANPIVLAGKDGEDFITLLERAYNTPGPRSQFQGVRLALCERSAHAGTN